MYQITVTTLKCTRKTKWNFWNNLLNLLHTHTHTWIWIFNRCKHKAPLDSTAGGINECKYIRWFNFLFTPSPELNIILGHTRSSHSESLSLVLNCLAYYFYHTLATVETRWSVIDFKAKILLGGHYGCFSGKIFAPTKGPRRNPTSLPALAAKLDKFPYTLRIYVQKTTRQETQGNIFPNVDRGHKGGILSFHWRRLACLFFDSKLTAKWWYLRSSFWREYFSPRQTSTPARHFGSQHQQEEKKKTTKPR